MLDELVQFAWEVNLDGYEIVSRDRSFSVKTTTGRKMREASVRFVCELVGPTFEVKKYNLDTETAMFRTFGCLSPDEADIKTFAAKYGRLGGNSREWIENGPDTPPTIGERITEWQDEILLMRRTVDLWDKARESRVKELAAVIHWPSKSQVFYVPPDDQITASVNQPPECIASPEHNRDLLEKMPPKNVLQPARYLIQRKVNAKLKEHNVAAQLLWADPSHKRLGIHMAPSSLIGAMWLQFAYAVARNPSFGRCAQCKKWFEYTRGKRLGAKFCGDSCRVRFHNARKRGERPR